MRELRVRFERWLAAAACAALVLSGCGGTGGGPDGRGGRDARGERDRRTDGDRDGAADGDAGEGDGGDGGDADAADLGPVDGPPDDLTTDAPLPTTAVGLPCTTNDECGPGGFCATESMSGFPGGYCTLGCQLGMPSTCGANATCLEVGQNTLCIGTCTEPEDCREGYGCADNFFGTVDPNGPGTRFCAPGDPAARPGDPCAGFADCAPGSGVCLDATGSGYPEGYCTELCDLEDPDACGDDAVCVATSFGGLCAARCGAGGTCRAGYSCVQHFSGAEAGADVCAPGLAELQPIGTPCLDASGCGAGRQICLLDLQGFTGGYCTQACDPRAPASCQIEAGGPEGFCLPTDATQPGAGICLASCTAPGTGGDAECAALRGTTPGAYGCSSRGFGFPLPQPVCLPHDPAAGLGSPCLGIGGCPLGTTCLTADQAYPGGYCSDVCNPAQPGSAGCGEGNVCFARDPQNPAAGGVCLLGCAEASGCRAAEGYVCAVTEPGDETSRACIPE